MTDIKRWKAAELIEAYGQGRGDAGSEIARRLREFDTLAATLDELWGAAAEVGPDNAPTPESAARLSAALDAALATLQGAVTP